MSLEKNAIVFVVGDNDTYPLWMVQVVKGIRPDVLVLNTALFMEPVYHKNIIEKYQILADESILAQEQNTNKKRLEILGKYIESLVTKTTTRPIYFGLTVGTEVTTRIKDNLYLTGLAQKYSAKRFDNIAILKNNWQKFRLDYLSLEFYSEENNANATWLPEFNMNYIAPVAVLYEHYVQSGEYEKSESLKTFALEIAIKGDQQKEVQKYLDDIDHNIIKTSKTEEQIHNIEQNFTIRPNPAQNTVILGIPANVKSRIIVTDMRGGIIKEMENISGDTTIQTNDFLNGSYIVQFFTEFGAFSKTLVISR